MGLSMKFLNIIRIICTVMFLFGVVLLFTGPIVSGYFKVIGIGLSVILGAVIVISWFSIIKESRRRLESDQ